MKKIADKIKHFREIVEGNLNVAPGPIRRRIINIGMLCAILFSLSVLIVLFSFIPPLAFIRNLALICMVIGIYILMAVPRYLRCCREHSIVTGTVSSIKKNTIKSTFSTSSYNRVMLNDCTTVAVSEQDITETTEDGPLEIQIPNTYFLNVSKGKRYTFYYEAPGQTDDAFAVKGFICFVQAEDKK